MTTMRSQMKQIKMKKIPVMILAKSTLMLQMMMDQMKSLILMLSQMTLMQFWWVNWLQLKLNQDKVKVNKRAVKMMIAKKKSFIPNHPPNHKLKWLKAMTMKSYQRILTIAKLISKLCWRANKNNLKNKRVPKLRNQAKLQCLHQNKNPNTRIKINLTKRKERETRKTKSEFKKYMLLCLIKTNLVLKDNSFGLFSTFSALFWFCDVYNLGF